MVSFLQVLVVGLGLAAIYTLLALGFVIVYKSTGILNFAYPGMMALGAYGVVHLSVVWGWPFLLATALAIGATALLGMLIERSVVRPMITKPVFSIIIATLGLDIILRAFANRAIGVDVRNLGDPWGFSVVLLGDVTVQQRHVVMIVVTVAVVAALAVFFKRSRWGIAMRATALDREVAAMQGISLGAVFVISWALAGALAALAGMFVGTGSGFDQQSAFVALKAIPAMILGGMDSIGGALVGALIIGLAEALTAAYQPVYLPALGSQFSLVVPYLVMIAVLIFRPYGLFGTSEVKRA